MTTAHAPDTASPRPRLNIGHLAIDQLTFPQAVQAIGDLVDAHRGGYVFTANVDHVVLAETNTRFRDAYDKATLSVVDGMPIVWASRMLDVSLPERIAGSDLILPLVKLGAERKWRIFLLGAGPGVAEKVGRQFQAQYPGIEVVGWDSPMVNLDAGDAQNDPIVARIREQDPHLLFVALGSPKQEVWISQVAQKLGPTVAIGIGAGFDFIAGTAKRAPEWIARAGFEWLYRLTNEPKRLWRRYILNDSKFGYILLRELWQRTSGRQGE
ncbi:glycosyltransferase [Corallococcus praedator]|uniref:Glycosyltransferase n=1 Tax=Corallococcus praedator TaxID=2316724 RepID=A0ABX9QD69_9BACT|nr:MULTISPECIES: exopolysaccharide biosynthesis glycosyltransferase EpsA [Corallococcus]RKH07762.1 glycosyltransferase [Corallococcus sp. CA047B]RKH32186.1 glycosyltransferase [Corallococcus sp. CA031C]RKH97874.1 glycosyltransferase [Corallococcus praedator]